MKVFAIKDTVADEFLMPFYQKNEKSANRAFNFFLAKPENAHVANDFELYIIGSYDADSGVITGIEPRRITDNDVLDSDE